MASASQQSQDLMNQVLRLQDQVKEIQGIVEMKVPSDQNRTGSAIMTDAPEQADTNPYSRLMKLNKASMVNNYENISTFAVAIVGLGGIGAPLAEMLVRSGIGKLVLFDMKNVQPSDLNRMFYRPEHVGLSKTQACKATLNSINPNVFVETYAMDVTAEGAQELILEKLRGAGCESGDALDLIVSCVDNRDARLAVHEVRKELCLEWMDGSQFPNGLTGCTQFIPDGAMGLEFALDVAVPPGTVLPSLPSTTAILAGMLCQSVLKHLLGFGVVQRFASVNTVTNELKTEAPTDSTDLI